MRVLFATVPQAGHFNPPLPLAHAFAANGHQVAYATSPDFVKRVKREGFEPFAVGPEFDSWFGELARRVGGIPGEGLAPEEIMEWFTPRLFAQVGVDLTLPDLIDAVASWQPDLVVYDTYNFAAPIAATLAGLQSVSHTVSPLPPVSIFERCGEAVATAWERHGLSAPPFGGIFDTACLSLSPPSLDGSLPAELAARTWRLRPVGYDRGGGRNEAPDWLDVLPDRPTVYATLGTQMNTDRAVFSAILDGLSGEDVNVIVTVGEGNDPTVFEPVPVNARVEAYIPQSLLLDRCAALVSHGGSGTILPALARGIPEVLIPQGADNFTNAERCVKAGAGIEILPGDVTGGTVRDAVRAVLDDPKYREAARQLAAEIAAMPGPDEVARQLEKLASC